MKAQDQLKELISHLPQDRQKMLDSIKEDMQHPAAQAVAEPEIVQEAKVVETKSKRNGKRNGNGNGQKHIDPIKDTVSPEVAAAVAEASDQFDKQEIEETIDVVPSNNKTITVQQAPQGRTPAEEDSEGMKSEVVKQLFDVKPYKIAQRTDLPDRVVLPFAMQDTANFVLTHKSAVVPIDPNEDQQLASSHFMRAYGYLRLSVRRRIRTEGIATLTPPGEGDVNGADVMHM
jgi:hypothetical protein